MIKYIKGDLFSAPPTQLLTHACNCQGVWGSGIAKQFRDLYPAEFILYREYCNYHSAYVENILGEALIINNVGCLFTSKNYGHYVDLPDKILKSTQNALEDLLSKTTMDIAMPKINSGLFKIPWEQTAEIIELVSCGRDIFVYTGKE